MSALLEIAPGLYQAPRHLSASLFLLNGPQVTVVDGGLRGSHPRVIRSLAQIGRRCEDVGLLMATHCHTDHVGGLSRLRSLCNAQVAVHEAEASFVDGSCRAPNPFQHRVLAWLTDPVLRRACPATGVDLRLRDGDTANGFRIVHTPGHTPGSISLLLPEHGVLIVGDAMEYRAGRLGPPSALFTADMRQAKASIQRLAELDFDTLCFSHFPPIRKNARRTLREFAGTLSP